MWWYELWCQETASRVMRGTAPSCWKIKNSFCSLKEDSLSKFCANNWLKMCETWTRLYRNLCTICVISVRLHLTSSVATDLRYDGNFYNYFVVNFIIFLANWQIWQSYCKNSTSPFFWDTLYHLYLNPMADAIAVIWTFSSLLFIATVFGENDYLTVECWWMFRRRLKQIFEGSSSNVIVNLNKQIAQETHHQMRIPELDGISSSRVDIYE